VKKCDPREEKCGHRDKRESIRSTESAEHSTMVREAPGKLAYKSKFSNIRPKTRLKREKKIDRQDGRKLRNCHAHRLAHNFLNLLEYVIILVYF